MQLHTKPGNEPPPHVHEREHELYFVLEGTIRFYCEDKVMDVGAGEVVFLPQGKPHAFTCTSEVVRTLILVQATGEDAVVLDSYILALGKPATSMVLPGTVVTDAVVDPEQAIPPVDLSGIRILSPEETRQALPQYPGVATPVY